MDKKTDNYVSEKDWRKKVFAEAVKEKKAELQEEKEKRYTEKIPTKSPSYLQPKKILSKSEYAEYKTARIQKRKAELMQELRTKIRPQSKELARRERYEGSKSGAVSRTVLKIHRFIRSPARALYGSSASLQQSEDNRRRILMAQAIRNQRMQEQQRFNETFNSGSIEARKLENELSFSGRNSVASAGDESSRRLQDESFSIASNLINNPIASTNQEAAWFSNFQEAKAVMDISNEANFFSNILSPSKKRRINLF